MTVKLYLYLCLNALYVCTFRYCIYCIIGKFGNLVIDIGIVKKKIRQHFTCNTFYTTHARLVDLPPNKNSADISKSPIWSRMTKFLTANISRYTLCTNITL